MRSLAAGQRVALHASVPPSLVSAKTSFVVAESGEAYLYSPAAGVERQLFLSGVHRSFGFSSDGRYFLYVKANGTLPGFDLYRLNLADRSEEKVDAGAVVFAAWSPNEAKFAFVEMQSASQFRLVVHDVESGSNREILTGKVDPDSVAWAEDGRRLAYSTVTALSGAAFHNRRYRFEVNEYDLDTGAARVIGEARRGVYMRGRLITSDALEAAASGGALYTTVLEDGHLVVKKTDAAGNGTVVGRGRIHAAMADGVVVREPGANYRYTSSNPRSAARTFAARVEPLAASQNLAAVSSWKLPFAGSAYMVQGGDLYRDNSCDGAVCLLGAHYLELGYATDWQQRFGEGQGNTHILAVAPGTVAAFVNSVTCNTVATTCPDYTSGVCDDNDGAGNYVAVSHADGTYSFYAHLSPASVQVAVGQVVAQGTYLALQGHSGGAGTYNNYLNCGEHLHYQRQISPAVWAQSVPTDFTDAPCALACTVSYTSQNVEGGAAPSLAVQLNPTTVAGTVTTTTHSVVLSAPAPAGGTVVTLTSSNSAVASVPGTVTVVAGATSATFSIAAQAVAADTNVQITATAGTSTNTATLLLQKLALTTLTLSSTSVAGGTTLTGNRVTLNGPAPGSGFSVALSSSAAAAQVPASVAVGSGVTSAVFNITTSQVGSNTQATISATGGGVVRSAVLTVTGSAALAAPVLLAPANGATGVTLLPTISWSPSAGATYYTVYMGTSSNPGPVKNTTATSWTPTSALNGSTRYYWRIVARNSVESTTSATWSFTTQVTPPGAFNLVSPGNGSTGVSLYPTLRWSTSARATSYDVYLGTTSNPGMVANVTGTSYNRTVALTRNTRYYWYIVARNSAGTLKSAVLSFTTGNR